MKKSLMVFCLGIFLVSLIGLVSSAGEKIVLVNMDDARADWNVEVSNYIVNQFHANDLALTAEASPDGINSDEVFRDYVKNWITFPDFALAQSCVNCDCATKPQSAFNFSEMLEDIDLGRTEYNLAGIENPFIYLPSCDYGNVEVLDALKTRGFHAISDYAFAPEIRDGKNNSPLTINDGLDICEGGLLLSETDIKFLIDFQIDSKGYAIISFHHQSMGDVVPDTVKINNLIVSLKNIQSQGYVFMNAEQYYQHLINPVVPNVTCVPNWSCSDWSSCKNDERERTCEDLNNCATNQGKPDEKKDCSSSSSSHHSHSTHSSEDKVVIGGNIGETKNQIIKTDNSQPEEIKFALTEKEEKNISFGLIFTVLFLFVIFLVLVFFVVRKFGRGKFK